MAIREYFARVAKAVEDGIYDPVAIDWEGLYGEEEGTTETE